MGLMKKKVLIISGGLALAAAAVFAAFCIVNFNKVEETPEENKGTNQPVVKRDIAYVNKDAETSDITKVDGIVNVYVFWGNGCPHCKAEWEYIESIRKEHANDFQAFGFEVWYDHDNRTMMETFADAMRVGKVNSVPFTIIGKKTFDATVKGDEFLKAVEEAKKSNFDVYFDKVKQR